MIRINYLLITVLISILVMYSCNEDNNAVDNFDYAGQAVKDNDSIVKFLKSHYFDTTIDSIKPLITGKTALFDDSKLKMQEIKDNDISYKLYRYVNEIGTPYPVKESPTVVDSVFVAYSGYRIDKSKQRFFEKNRAVWFRLDAVIKGWTHGFTHFKAGKNITTSSLITYEDYGKGILFIPSGLAYGNKAAGIIPANSSLIFYIQLWDLVEKTDHDNDNIASFDEDLDEDGDPKNDDTDKDGKPNYLDDDDDGDGVPTRLEDKNGDGDPRNDFNDPNNPNLPDYLNFKIR